MDLNPNNLFEQKKLATHNKSQPSNLSVSTIIAKVVTVYKVENNSSLFVGKYGFALAGDKESKHYQILLYGKNTILINYSLNKDFVYNVFENNCVEIITMTRWRLEFANIHDAVDFNSNISLILWKLNNPKIMFWIDLYYPIRNGVTAKFGSVVEVTFSAKIIQGKTIGPEVSNNYEDNKNLKVLIRNEGWEKSLMGVNVGTQRIIYIPAAEMGAWKILTDGHQSLCLIVNVKNVYEMEDDNAQVSLIMNKEIKIKLNNSSSDNVPNQNDQVVLNNINSSKKLLVETLSEELAELKKEHSKTIERLEKLEISFNEFKLNKSSSKDIIDLDLRKCLKKVYKSLIKEFPTDQSFTGNQVQFTIREIFYNYLSSQD
ncbi:FK506-binding protein 15-like [Daktulosphaira vitifoliae]|uniref:FK506-binding protein 15-like n=1 Tax=Daktulosphaira vitifoliae TaxID=58002 RepID=UPI0021AAF91F|nr:FK506-binding protein 15-like [Daktulosphaira vitifoliae]